MEGLSYFTHLSSIAIFGGNDAQSFVAEKKALQMGADIIVCTPGRMIAHLNMGYVNLKGLQFLVLDEADRMLDMGFVYDVKKIISRLPAQRQNLLFSATMPEGVHGLISTILHDPIRVEVAPASSTVDSIEQMVYFLDKNNKQKLLADLINIPSVD